MNIEEQQEQVQKRENESDENNNAYSLFLYGIRSPVTRDYYLRRLRIFFNYIKLLPDETMEKRCKIFGVISWQLEKVRVKDYLRLRVYQCSDISLQHPN